MPRLARVLGAAVLLAAGLVLPTGPARAAACSGTTGVTVVIDYGSTSTTSCAPESSSAMAALRAVASVTEVQTQPGFICQINAYPDTSCVRTPPATAYWAFFHAARGGSWTYSTSGAGSYDPPSGSVIGFAFGSGGAPSSAPPAAAAPAPKPSAKPSPKPSPKASSTPRTTPPASSSPSRPAATTPRPRVTVLPDGSTTTAAATPRGSSTTSAVPSATRLGPSAAATPTGQATTATDGSTVDTGSTTVASAARTGDGGSPTTLLAGLGLVGLVGAAAAYVAVRRRTDG
jgi:hypothetical protein